MEQSAPFIVYNASAGAGKTFTIVKKYLSLLFLAQRKDAYKNVLAITFTNKAVNEMKTRVIESLIAFSENSTPAEQIPLLQAVVEETGFSEKTIKEKSRKTLKSLVHNYAAFDISTIDSFTNRILRTFAKDLGLSVNFELEMDVQGISAEAVDRIIAKAGEDSQLTKTLVRFALSKADVDKSWNITMDLNEIAKLLSNENNFQPLQLLKEKSLEDFETFAKELKTETKRLEAEITETGTAFFTILAENGLDAADFKKHISTYFSKIQQQDFPTEYKSKWQADIANADLYNKTLASEKKSSIETLRPEITELFEKSKTLVFRRLFFREIDKNLIQLSLLNTIQQEVEEIKRERNLLLISDFNKKISASIKDQPVPFIYERLGERYRDYFIDEAQDTSLFQWENLVPLIGNPLSGMDEQGRTGSLTLVGDAKQAIYRFRGGKAEQFMDLAQTPGTNPFPVEKKVETLPSNYRSYPEIVHFNNSFFKHSAQYLGFATHRALFENAHQEDQKEGKGYVNISFVEGKNQAETTPLYCEKTLEIIKKLEANGYPKKAICVLVRKKREGIAVAEHLSQHNIPIISSETLLISKSPKVQFINNLLAFSLNQKDDVLKIDLLYFLHASFSLETELHAFISTGLEHKEAHFFDYLERHGSSFRMELMQSMALYNAVEYSIRSFGLVEGSDAYVQFYLDFVLDYAQKNRGGISGFLEHWHDKAEKLSIVAPEGEDAVQIMTIHKSKGLEFPIVIYPFANEKIDETTRDNCWVALEEPFNTIPVAHISASKKMMEYSKNAAEEYGRLLLQKELDALNLLYVACTRAKKQLYIISEGGDEKKESFKMNQFSHFFISYLKSLNRWEEGVFSYEFGEFLPNTAHEPDNPLENPITDQLPPATSASKHLNIVTKSGVMWGNAQEEAIQRGNVLHEIMNFVGIKDDLENALEKAIRLGIIHSGEKAIFQQKLSEIINAPEIAEYYHPGVVHYNEQDILDRGELLRPDRIILKDNNVVLLDYKTGKVLPKHELQIARYAEAMENKGYLVQKSVLVYINDRVTVKIV